LRCPTGIRLEAAQPRPKCQGGPDRAASIADFGISTHATLPSRATYGRPGRVSPGFLRAWHDASHVDASARARTEAPTQRAREARSFCSIVDSHPARLTAINGQCVGTPIPLFDALPASSNRACPRSLARCRSARSGCTKSIRRLPLHLQA